MKIVQPCCPWILLLSAFLASPVGAQTVIPGPDVLFFQGQTVPAFAGVMPFFHEESRPLAPGKTSIQTAVLYFNTFRQDDRNQDPDVKVIMDMEGVNWGLSLRHSPLADWELGLEVQGMGTFGGILDPALSGFHQTFGLPNQSRELFPSNTFRWELYYKGRLVAEESSGGAALTQVSGALKYLLPLRWTPEGRFSVKFWAKPPLPEQVGFFLTDIWSLGAGVLYSDRVNFQTGSPVDAFVWGASAGLAYVPPSPWPLPGRTFLYQGGGHAGLLAGGWYWGVQAAVFQAPFDLKSHYLGYRSGEMHLGLKAPLGPLWWEVALVEEFLTWGTMEVGFHSGVSWSF